MSIYLERFIRIIVMYDKCLKLLVHGVNFFVGT